MAFGVIDPQRNISKAREVFVGVPRLRAVIYSYIHPWTNAPVFRGLPSIDSRNKSRVVMSIHMDGAVQILQLGASCFLVYAIVSYKNMGGVATNVPHVDIIKGFLFSPSPSFRAYTLKQRHDEFIRRRIVQFAIRYMCIAPRKVNSCCLRSIIDNHEALGPATIRRAKRALFPIPIVILRAPFQDVEPGECPVMCMYVLFSSWFSFSCFSKHNVSWSSMTTSCLPASHWAVPTTPFRVGPARHCTLQEVASAVHAAERTKLGERTS